MIPIQCDCILLDIEGTTSSISFVYDKMFPFVRENLHHFLTANWNDEELTQAVKQIASDAKLSDWPDRSLPPAEQQNAVAAEVIRQMDSDIKATGLKMLQGQIWKSGFDSGELQAHIYEDVKPAIESWKSLGKDISIYSSGSVQAQLLFFGHTIQGDLLSHFSAHYDTKIGSKKEVGSYDYIANQMGVDPKRILFISDIVAELEAAAAAGFQVLLSLRPGNAKVSEPLDQMAIGSFAEIAVS